MSISSPVRFLASMEHLFDYAHPAEYNVAVVYLLTVVLTGVLVVVLAAFILVKLLVNRFSRFLTLSLSSTISSFNRFTSIGMSLHSPVSELLLFCSCGLESNMFS